VKKRILIGELLVRTGVIRKEHVEEALRLQKNTKKKLGEILLQLGYVHPRILNQKLCEQAGIPFMELQPKLLDTQLAKLFPYRVLYENNILPLYEKGNTLHVATGDPANQKVARKLRQLTKKQIVLCGAEPKQITRLLVKI
jgi:type IV pilus assembly protein PilB